MTRAELSVTGIKELRRHSFRARRQKNSGPKAAIKGFHDDLRRKALICSPGSFMMVQPLPNLVSTRTRLPQGAV